MSNKKSEKTEYEKMVTLLNGASRRKADLVKFCEDKLKMTNLASYTIPRIQQLLALVRIYEVAATDFGLFGKHSDLHEDPGYCQWVVETARNPGQEGCCHRLRRLATWLETQKPSGPKNEEGAAVTFRPTCRSARNQMARSSGSNMDLHEYQQRNEKRMEKVMDNEMVALKGEPSRKREAKSEEETAVETDSSWLPNGSTKTSRPLPSTNQEPKI